MPLSFSELMALLAIVVLFLVGLDYIFGKVFPDMKNTPFEEDEKNHWI